MVGREGLPGGGLDEAHGGEDTATSKRAEDDTWFLVAGPGRGSYLEIEKPAALDIVEVSRDGADVPSLEALAVCVTTGPLKDRRLELVGHADPLC